jgi:SAM-dependent methyltransferase
MADALSVQEHYERHLASIYAWSLGDTEAAFARARLQLAEAAIPPGKGATAVDLGCGFGLHAIPLADLGYRVVAIDQSSELLSDLRARAGERPIQAVQDDLQSFDRHLSVQPELILCLGDTLTHLAAIADVSRLLETIAQKLAPGGLTMLGFRDYIGNELTGVDRFIPVRSDDSRIFTCFLEYSPEWVTVHDLVHEKTPSGWQQKVSAYRKIRLDPAWVIAELHRLGLVMTHRSAARGMTILVAQKTP